MKTEINLGNKAKFFAQYYGQSVFEYKGSLPFINLIYFGRKLEKGFLHLKTLSLITDEDAIVAGRLHGHHNDEEPWSDEYLIGVGKRVCSYFPKFTTPTPVSDQLNLIDFLRSKGYALPWMGLSVDEMVQAGWIKLKENETN